MPGLTSSQTNLTHKSQIYNVYNIKYSLFLDPQVRKNYQQREKKKESQFKTDLSHKNEGLRNDLTALKLDLLRWRRIKLN